MPLRRWRWRPRCCSYWGRRVALAAPSNDDFEAAQCGFPPAPTSGRLREQPGSDQGGRRARPRGGLRWPLGLVLVDAVRQRPVGITTGCSLSFEALVAVYTGSAVDALTPVASSQGIPPPTCFGESPEVESRPSPAPPTGSRSTAGAAPRDPSASRSRGAGKRRLRRCDPIGGELPQQPPARPSSRPRRPVSPTTPANPPTRSGARGRRQQRPGGDLDLLELLQPRHPARRLHRQCGRGP